METGFIKITDMDSNKSTVEIKLINGTVWMTTNEIADLFGVHISTINKHLKGIFKDNLLRMKDVTKEYRYTCPENGECIRIYYNLEVVIFLSFQIQSIYTQALRNWIIYCLTKHSRREETLDTFIICNLGADNYSLLNLN
ncbi:MAG: hypothetical protein LBU84_10320 [Prevotella sp.]|jgi:hypothetical protein|nr:hypothetical protein [Prevotella sp.]